jgi:hypothetical protein
VLDEDRVRLTFRSPVTEDCDDRGRATPRRAGDELGMEWRPRSSKPALPRPAPASARRMTKKWKRRRLRGSAGM